MTYGEKVLAEAKKDIGYKESAGKRNKFGAWFGMDGVAWCMEAAQYWYDKAGIKLPYKTASCSALLNWYHANQPECVVKTPTVGCLVIFDLPNTGVLTDHVGIFESLNGANITTVDGNTSGLSDANGGCVNRRTRKKNWVHAYIKPRGLESIVPGTTTAAAAIDKLARLGVINSPEMWKNTVDSGKVKYLDALIIKAAEKITKAGPRSSSVENGVGALVAAGIINTPEYWLNAAAQVPNVGALLMALGGAVRAS